MLSLSSRPNSLSSNSLSSSTESLSSTYADSCWSMDHQDLFRIPQTKAAKTSDYETGLSATEYDEEEGCNKVTGKVSKARLDETCMHVSCSYTYRV